MSRYTVAVTDTRFEDLSIEREGLADLAEVVVLSEDREEALAELADADAVINLVREVDGEMVAALPADCRIIARYGIGVDNIDAGAAAERGIPVVNDPDYCVEEVATHAMAMILSLARRLKPYDAAMADGEWKTDRADPIEHRFSSQTVGVVGYGAIGSLVGTHAAALGADVLAFDPYLDPEDVGEAATLVDLPELYERADYVTVHTPLTGETRGIVDADAFGSMKDTAFLINVARGPIVDESALIEALRDQEIAGAGLDVFEDEPLATDSPLRGHPDVVATPHDAWYSEEANTERRHNITRAVRLALEGERPPNVVNGVDVGGGEGGADEDGSEDGEVAE
jgi:D-3-phosphoglycerate dehydrogenase